MIKYLIIHNKHEGCYDFQFYEDQTAKMRLTSITINPPKIFMFHDKEQAHEFFSEYINDVDVIDPRCRKGEEVEHIDYCTCGIIELDEEENPVLFYNKRNQIFLLENSAQVFLPPQELKNDICNLNLTNKLIRKCKSLDKEQRKRYIELGKMCQECSVDDTDDETEPAKEEPVKPVEEHVKPEKEEPVKTVSEENIVMKPKKSEKKHKKSEKNEKK
jgi:hypothetical protein